MSRDCMIEKSIQMSITDASQIYKKTRKKTNSEIIQETPYLHSMSQLPLKYTALSLSAIVSTFFALISVPILGTAIIVMIDTVVNSTCLLLMKQKYK